MEPQVEPLSLADGRRLDIRTSEPTGGLVLVFHHGTPGSVVPFRAIERAAHARGLRPVTTSRPGSGGSSAQPGRRVVDVVADTEAGVAHLGADRCLVAGWSGGGPHALACAARLAAAAGALIIAGVAPYGAEGLDWMAGKGQDNVDEFGAALDGEEPLRAYLEQARHELADVTVEGIVTSLDSLLPDVDRAVLTDEFGQDMVPNSRRPCASGSRGGGRTTWRSPNPGASRSTRSASSPRSGRGPRI